MKPDANRKMLSLRLRPVVHQLLDEILAATNAAVDVPHTKTDVVEQAIIDHGRKILKKKKSGA